MAAALRSLNAPQPLGWRLARWAARAAVMGVTVKRAPAYWMLRLPSARPIRVLSKPPSPEFANGPIPAGTGTPPRRKRIRQ